MAQAFGYNMNKLLAASTASFDTQGRRINKGAFHYEHKHIHTQMTQTNDIENRKKRTNERIKHTLDMCLHVC